MPSVISPEISKHSRIGTPSLFPTPAPVDFKDHPLQGIMARTGSFPLRVASTLLSEEIVKQRSIVLDPFCGKGTSLLAARLLGHSAYGMDVAPEAVICTAAKMAAPTLKQYATYIANMSIRREKTTVPERISVFFHPDTLVELVAIRRRLIADLEKSDTRRLATFTFAVLLGILHGHASYSLSISSAHAYSMSPKYVSRYAAEHNLQAPRRDVRACLLQKGSMVLGGTALPAGRFLVKQASALYTCRTFVHLKGGVDAILTSPPYLHAQTYAKDNWLRHWLLGFDIKTLQSNYLQTSSADRYTELMQKVLLQCMRMLRPGGKLICVAGDVRLPRRPNNTSERQVFRTGDVLARLCEKLGTFRVTNQCMHRVASASRYYHALSSSNGHTKQELIERVFVAEKVSGGGRR